MFGAGFLERYRISATRHSLGSTGSGRAVPLVEHYYEALRLLAVQELVAWPGPRGSLPAAGPALLDGLGHPQGSMKIFTF